MSTDILTPPHSIEAEESVIGSVLIDPLIIRDCGLGEADFYLVKNRWIWGAMVALDQSGVAVDYLTVQEELRKRGQLDEIGGPAYLTRLIQFTPTAFNAPDYARNIRLAAVRRRMIQVASDLAKAAYDNSSDELDMLSKYAAALDAMAPAFGENYTTNEAGFEWLEQMRQWVMTKSIPGLSTGYRKIDQNTHGLKRGELCILAARPSMGKSALAFQIAYRMARLRYKVGIFSMEMTKASVIERIALSLLNADRFALTALDMPKLEGVMSRINDMPMLINEESLIPAAEVARQAREMARLMNGLDVVVIDHIGYMQHIGERGETKAARIGNTTKALMRLAKEMRCAVLCVSQLRRSDYAENSAPDMDDLRESGDLEQDARQIWMLHRPAYYAEIGSKPPKDKPQDAMLIVRKNHNGPRDVAVTLGFTECSALFDEL